MLLVYLSNKLLMPKAVTKRVVRYALVGTEPYWLPIRNPPANYESDARILPCKPLGADYGVGPFRGFGLGVRVVSPPGPSLLCLQWSHSASAQPPVELNILLASRPPLRLGLTCIYIVQALTHVVTDDTGIFCCNRQSLWLRSLPCSFRPR